MSRARNDIAGPMRCGSGALAAVGRSTGAPARVAHRALTGGVRLRGRRPGDEPVADPANRHEVDRVVRIRLDLLAEAAHRHPDVRRVGVVGVAPAAVEERLRADRVAEVRRERVQQARLGRRRAGPARPDGRRLAPQVERELRADGQLAVRHLVAEPAHDPRDPRPELGVVVRLGDVVLGDLLEQVRLRVRGVDRREDDDRQVSPRLDLAGEGQPVHAGHHHVDDQEVRPAAVEPPQRLLAVARGLDLEAVVAQLVGQQDEQVRVVVDDEDARPRRPPPRHPPLSMAGGYQREFVTSGRSRRSDEPMMAHDDAPDRRSLRFLAADPRRAGCAGPESVRRRPSPRLTGASTSSRRVAGPRPPTIEPAFQDRSPSRRSNQRSSPSRHPRHASRLGRRSRSMQNVVDRPGVPNALRDKYWWTGSDVGLLGTTAQLGLPSRERVVDDADGSCVAGRAAI